MENRISSSNFLFSKKLITGEVHEIKGFNKNIFLFVVTGSIILTHKYDNAVHLEGSQFILLPEQQNFQIISTQITDSLYITFENDENEWVCNTIQKLIPYCGKANFCFTPLNVNNSLQLFITSLKSYLANELDSYYLFQIKQKELFFLLNNTYTFEERLQLFCPMVLRRRVDFKQFVLNNYMEIKSVPEFAALAGYSLSSFKRRFYEHFNEPVYNWLQKQKASEIRVRLNDNSDYKIIIKEFGFSSYNSFSKFCKKFLGETPSSIKNKNSFFKEKNKQDEYS